MNLIQTTIVFSAGLGLLPRDGDKVWLTPETAASIREGHGKCQADRSTDGKVLLAALPESKGNVIKVELPGHKGKLNFKQTAERLEVELLAHQPCKFAHGLKITGDIQ